MCLSCICLLAMRTLICVTFSLPPGVGGWLWLLLEVLPELFGLSFCICLKNVENIQISINMIDRLDITDEYSVKCDFILNTAIFIDALNIPLKKLKKL